jgi:acyl-CoA thioester hydrolase
MDSNGPPIDTLPAPVIVAAILTKLTCCKIMSPLERFKDLNIAYQGMFYPMETDHMGHANVRYYSRAFNESAYFTFTTADITPNYMRENNRGMAAVTENYEYKREIMPGDLIQVRTCFINFTPKSLHVWAVMIDACTDEICAINDQVCVSLDTIVRKSTPWPDAIFEKGKSLVRERPVFSRSLL